MKYARIESGVVVEILSAPTGFAVEDCFHADVVTAAVKAPDEIGPGWLYEGDKFSPPPPPLPLPPPPTPTEKLAAFLTTNPDVGALI